MQRIRTTAARRRHGAVVDRAAAATAARRPLGHTSALRRAPRPVAVRALASSAAAPFSAYPSLSQPYVVPAAPALAPLPKPPSAATLLDVLPYLARLALAEKQLMARVGLALCCMVTSKVAGLLCPMFLKQAVDALSTSLPPAVAAAAALKAVVSFGACDILKHAAKEMQHPIFTPVSQAVARRMAYHTFAHVLDLDVRFHLERRTGRLSRILERGSRSVQMLFRALVFTFVPTTLELLFVCGLLGTTFSPAVAALVGVTFVLYVAWTFSMTQLATQVRKEVNQLDNMVSSKAVDALLNFETVTLFNNQRLEVGQYDEYLTSFQKAAVRTEQIAAALNTGQSAILAAGLTTVMAAVVTGFGGGTPVTAGDVVLIQGLLVQLWTPLQFLGWFYRELRQSLVDTEEFLQVLQTRSELPQGSQPLPDRCPPQHAASAPAAAPSSLAAANGGGNGSRSNGAHAAANGTTTATSSESLAAEDDVFYGQSEEADSVAAHGRRSSGPEASTSGGGGLRVELRGAKFGYQPEKQILRGVDITVQPGQSVAIVGPSGSGKSTVLRLVTRMYDVSEGSVLVNGVDVRQLKTDALRDAVAVVPQDTVLFNDSILANIRYGRTEARDEEVIAAAQAAKLHDAVMRMPAGYQTVVGERGLKLSGGEKQRVAIARAFLRKPRLLICDEATSALDSATEAAILSSLDDLARGRTSIFVAHRLSTIKNCDRIVVLRNGVVVEEGTHEQLLRAGGMYVDLWEMQQMEDMTGNRSTPSGMALAGSMGSGGEDSCTDSDEPSSGGAGGTGRKAALAAAAE